jgi:hypothetical protein
MRVPHLGGIASFSLPDERKSGDRKVGVSVRTRSMTWK